MFHVTVNLLLGILALKVVSSHGTNQHLICKIVADVFTDDSSAGHTNATPRFLHARPGKRGQTGVKGEPGISGLKGEKGDPGFANPENVKNVVEQKCAEANRQLLGRLEKLEETVRQLNSTVPDENRSRQNEDVVDETPCDKGFRFEQKCYFTIIRGSEETNLQEARSLCAAAGGKLADILSNEHEELTAGRIRSQTTVETYVWLGMKYTPATSTLRWSTGTDVPEDVATLLQWFSSFPRSSSNYDTILLAVNSNTFGIANIRSNTNLHGAVCEK